jgi:hypothetical protein
MKNLVIFAYALACVAVLAIGSKPALARDWCSFDACMATCKQVGGSRCPAYCTSQVASAKAGGKCR